jgi:RNA polymerase sigma-70 factor (ECF subfamily)
MEHFRTTSLWSQVVHSPDRFSPDCKKALNELVRRYWDPIHAAIRHKVWKGENPEDLTQDFFAYVLEKDILDRFDREKGRLRTFLRGVLEYFLAEKFRRQRAKKRGGDLQVLSLEAMPVTPPQGASPGNDPRDLFEQEWGKTVMRRAWARMDRGENSEILRAFLDEPGKKGDGVYEKLAEQFGKNYQGIANELHRGRKRLKECILEEIRDYCADEEEAQEEFRYLWSVLQQV